MSVIFVGITSRLALWKAPLSSTITFNSLGFCKENSFKNNWKQSVLQKGNSNKNDAPFIGENAPNKYVDWKTCWKGQIGFTPLAVRALPFLVNKPNLLSSWK